MLEVRCSNVNERATKFAVTLYFESVLWLKALKLTE